MGPPVGRTARGTIDGRPGAFAASHGAGSTEMAIDSATTGGDERSNRREAFKALTPIALFAAVMLVDLPICPMKVFFGIPCPGCGLSRATYALLTLEPTLAIWFHPLAPVVLPVVVLALGRPLLISIGWLRADSHDPLRRVPQAAWVILVVVMLAVWVVRMAGGLGGHPDPVDPSAGLIGRALAFLTDAF